MPTKSPQKSPHPRPSKSPTKTPQPSESREPASLSIAAPSEPAIPGPQSAPQTHQPTRIDDPSSPTAIAARIIREADPYSRGPLIGQCIYNLIGKDPTMNIIDLQALDKVALGTLDRFHTNPSAVSNFDKLIKMLGTEEPGLIAMVLINVLGPSILAAVVEDF